MTDTAPETPYALPIDEGGEVLPMHWLFRELRDRWLSKGKKGEVRRSRDLAQRFGVTPQSVSQWATGTDSSKVAPWWAILSLADELRLEVRVSASEVSLVRRRRKKQS